MVRIIDCHDMTSAAAVYCLLRMLSNKSNKQISVHTMSSEGSEDLTRLIMRGHPGYSESSLGDYWANIQLHHYIEFDMIQLNHVSAELKDTISSVLHKKVFNP